MAKENPFPNLPDTKTCPTCKMEFPWPNMKNGRKLGGREWFIRVYCSQKCSRNRRQGSHDSLFR